jgi:hypothetical protein
LSHKLRVQPPQLLQRGEVPQAGIGDLVAAVEIKLPCCSAAGCCHKLVAPVVLALRRKDTALLLAVRLVPAAAAAAVDAMLFVVLFV